MKKYEMKVANLLIVEQSDGLLITQNKRTILARKWQLTDKVIAILNSSILKGFDKLWVEGHPRGDNAHYICFSKSHEKKSWEYLVGLESGPPNVSIITVNKSKRKLLEQSGFDFEVQKGGGKHLFFTYTQSKLDKLMEHLCR